MNIQESCHRLRITPTLLHWYQRYAPKADGQKLRESAQGQFEVADLDAFSTSLWNPWRGRNVPTGVSRELKLEAAGCCGLCGAPCETLEEAHIHRKGKELKHYTQHHLNLLSLCPNCHTRYDTESLLAISLQEVQHAKDRLISRKMESIDRDIAMEREVRNAIENAKRQARTGDAALRESNATLWKDHFEEILRSATFLVSGDNNVAPAPIPQHPVQSLLTLSGSLDPIQQLTHATLNAYAREAGGEVDEAPDYWEQIDYEEEPKNFECHTCHCLKDTVYYSCENCGHGEFETENPYSVVRNGVGRLVPTYEDARGDTFELTCSKCESEEIECDYPEKLCSLCAYREAKDD